MAMPMPSVAECDFHGHPYRITTCGAAQTIWALRSFAYEGCVRNKWWHIREGDVVIDLGAGYGSYTLTALAQGAACVLAFEPAKEDLYSLCCNLALNNFKGECWLFPLLVGDHTGEIGNYYPESHSDRVEGSPEERMMFSLDDLVAFKGLSKLDWIKIDVDDMEAAVIRGATKTLERFHPKLIIENHVQIIPGIDEEMRKLILPFGYKEDQIIGEGANHNWSYWE